MDKNIAVIILAAGKGERMKSGLPKVLHEICGRPMLGYVLDLVKSLRAKQVVCVLGHKHALVRKLIPQGIKVAVQKRMLGTADAVKTGLSHLKGFKGTVLVLYGDNPLLKKETVVNLLKFHNENNFDATLLTAQLEKPAGYGRILRDKLANICGIAEEKDADDFQKEIKEINTGLACFKKESLLSALRLVNANNRKKEYYLTDTIGIIYKNSGLTGGLRLCDINEALGINSHLDLAKANSIMQARINEGFMKSGVSIVAPESTFIGYGAKIAAGTTIYPFTVIESNVKIAKRCLIGPFAHLRSGTELQDDVVAGNFLEVVRTKISAKTLAKHFGYLGDSRIGKSANIGAGTVTANFDGKRKNQTLVGDMAFVGSDTVLVAPVEVGKKATTGAGSVVLKNIPAGKKVAGVPAKILSHQ